MGSGVGISNMLQNRWAEIILDGVAQSQSMVVKEVHRIERQSFLV